MTRRSLRWWASGLACAWIVLVLAAPWLARHPGTGTRVAAASYLVGGIVCHQKAERSLHLAGAQLPVCARCTGLYLGGALGMLLGIVLPVFGLGEPAGTLARARGWRTVLVLAVAPMAASVAMEWVGAWAVPGVWRAAASMPAAWAAGALAAESLSFRVTL